MNQIEKAAQFAGMHVRGQPITLYNAWDAGSADAIAKAGARAMATSSWAIAEAHGYRDGEAIPLAFVTEIVARIVATTALPLTVDFEGGYSVDDAELAANVGKLIALGVIGINFEDRVVSGAGLYSIERQATRIAAIRAAAVRGGVGGFFLNARTDLFLGRPGDPALSIHEALERGRAYKAAGASGFFVPGLRDATLIGQICQGVELPVNVMVMDGVPPPARLAELGVARISYGAIPYARAIKFIGEDAARAMSSVP